MEYQKIINLLDNTPNQPSKFKTKNWVEINDDARGTYNTNSQIKFSTIYNLNNGNNGNKEVAFKNCYIS